MSQLKGFKEEPGATLPVNDAERWIAGTYAIWSEYCGGSCKYLGGYEKTLANAKMLAKVLEDDWMVCDHDSGVDMVKYLLENAGPGDDGNDDFDDEDEEYDEDGEDFEDDDEEYDEDDEDFEDEDEEYDEDDEDFEDDDEEYDEDGEDFEDDDEEYDEDDEDFDDDEEYDEDDEEYDEDDEDFDDDEYEDYEIDTTAFDYACACNMCGRMFIAGYLTREEAISYATEAAKKIQELCNSWEEYFQLYMIGAAGGSNVRDIVPFAEAFQKVVSAPENPFDLDWNTLL